MVSFSTKVMMEVGVVAPTKVWQCGVAAGVASDLALISISAPHPSLSAVTGADYFYLLLAY